MANGVKTRLKKGEIVELMRKSYSDSDWLEVRGFKCGGGKSVEKRYAMRLVS